MSKRWYCLLLITVFNQHFVLLTWYKLCHPFMVTNKPYVKSNSIHHDNHNMVTLISFMIRFLLDVKFKLLLTHIRNKIKLKMEMEYVPKRQQPDHGADNSRRPTMGLECSEKLPHPEESFSWLLNKFCQKYSPLKLLRQI